MLRKTTLTKAKCKDLFPSMWAQRRSKVRVGQSAFTQMSTEKRRKKHESKKSKPCRPAQISVGGGEEGEEGGGQEILKPILP
jgi:hypothetical protein